MLKSLLLCTSTCLAFNFPVERSIMIFICMILNYNLKNINYYNTILDNLNCNLVVLSYLVIVLCILTNNKFRYIKKYLLCNTTLLVFLVTSFFSKNILFFFMLFESSLVPLFFLILGWGYQPERLQSSIYFLFYTLLGSLPLLVTIVIFRKFYFWNWTDNLPLLDIIFYITFIIAFLVKMPMFLVHLWLPKAHVEAPTVGSMILAGITLKLGRYALLRIFSISGAFTLKLNWLWIAIRVVGNLLLCIVCLRQTDLKSLIAYSSVVHMGLCLLTILFILNWSFEGGVWLSLSHGLASSGLFFLTNRTYLRFNRRRLYINKGLAFSLPKIRFWLFLLLIFNMASPPSLNLFREIKMVVTAVTISNFILIMSVISRFFCAAYCLFLFRNLHHGKHNRTQKFSNRLIILEHLVLFYHLWPLIVSLILISFIQWVIYLYSLSKNNDLWYHSLL